MKILAADSVQGRISLSVKEMTWAMTWAQVLDRITAEKGLAIRRNGKFFFIAPQADIDRKDFGCWRAAGKGICGTGNGAAGQKHRNR